MFIVINDFFFTLSNRNDQTRQKRKKITVIKKKKKKYSNTKNKKFKDKTLKKRSFELSVCRQNLNYVLFIFCIKQQMFIKFV